MSENAATEKNSEKLHKKRINSWVMYDWANSAFATTIMAAVLPVYYSSVASTNLTPADATANWAFTTTIALIIVAIMSPILAPWPISAVQRRNT